MAKQSKDKTQDKPTEALAPIVAIRLDAPGVKACGRFKAGQVYRVPGELSLEEAHRLVRIKGFSRLSEADLATPKPEPTQADTPAEQPEA